MLDLLISYLNFFIIGIKYIVKLIAFQPPNPQGYRIKNCEDEVQNSININPNNKIEILFLVSTPKETGKENNGKKNDSKQSIKKELKYRPAPQNISNFELLYIENEDNDTIIPIFLFTPKNVFSTPENLVIYCHGNSGDIGTSFIECQLLSRNCVCNVLCFEYPGYGWSNDKTNLGEKRSYYNIRQAYKYARDKLKYDPGKIIIYGFSLGTGIAFDIACDEDYPCGGIILQSPFLSIIRTIYNFKKTYYFDIFNSCDKAKKCKSKIFFIHGNRDTIVPYVHGRILSQLIPKECLYGFYTVDKANHNDILKHSVGTFYEKISAFILYCNHVQENKEPKEKEEEEKEKSSESDISFDNNKNFSYQNIRNRGKIKEFEKKINIDMDSYHNKISSNEELNRLKGDKQSNNHNFITESGYNKKSIEDFSIQKEAKKDKSDIFSRNDNDIDNNSNIINENPNDVNLKDISVNINNYNANSNTNDLNLLNSKTNCNFSDNSINNQITVHNNTNNENNKHIIDIIK